MGKFLFGIGLIAWIGAVWPQSRAIAFYDVDRLYDTVASPFGRDAEYLPRGRMRWTAQRYERKVRSIAAVIDSMALPLVGLYGVENEAVVRDLSAACTSDYSYVFRTTDSYNGLDFALLYYGDRFFPSQVAAGHFWMSVRGRLDDDEVVVLFSSSFRYIGFKIAEMRDRYPAARLIVLGRCEGVPADYFGLRRGLESAEKAGRGNARQGGRWVMRHDILVDTAYGSVRGDVYARRRLLDPDTYMPRATYTRTRYEGGPGANLPVFCYF